MLFRPLFADPEIAALFGADATLASMLAFERALADALVEVGGVEEEVGAAAIAAMDSFTADREAIVRGAATDGLPVPEFVRQLKSHVIREAGEEALAAVHIGATSQDLLDTATALALRGVNDILVERLERFVTAIGNAAEPWVDAPLMGRTRMQAALPIKVGDRVATWVHPIRQHVTSIEGLRGRVEQLQYGGPVGLRDAPGKRELPRIMAERLGLHHSPNVWHTDRTAFVEYGSCLTRITGSLGKFGGDVALMAQQGVDAIALSGGGTSSAMPHKNNPVLAEHLVAMARFNAGLAGTLQHAMLHEQERSGSAWALEWMCLPLMAETTGAALLHAERLAASIERMGEG